MSLASLAARYIQERLATLTQEAHQHLLDFVTLAESHVHAAEVNTEAAIAHLVSLGHTVLHPDGTASGGSAPAPVAPVVETRVYTDGTAVTGAAPLPDQSPAQQDAAASAAAAPAEAASSSQQPAPTPDVAPPPADAGTPEQAASEEAPIVMPAAETAGTPNEGAAAV